MTSYLVTGPAAVIKLKGGSERYLYKGAVVAGSGYTAASIQHHLDIGLIEEIVDVVVEPAPEALAVTVVTEPTEPETPAVEPVARAPRVAK